jgi:HEAT repeat protein
LAKELSEQTRVRRAKAAGDVEYLVQAVRSSGDLYARRSAARALGRLGDERAVKPLLRTLGASDVVLKNLAINALVRLGDPASLPALYDLAVEDRSPGVRVTAIAALADLGDRRGGDLLVQLLLDPAGGRRDTDAVEPWGLASRRRTRRWAAGKLTEVRAIHVVPQLRAAAANHELGWARRLALRRLLRKLRRHS